MKNSWNLEILTNKKQSSKYLSFIGGKPYLPIQEKVPSCVLCNSKQTFMFQIAFPTGHIWKGLSLAVFFCTKCANENHLIPTMLDTQLKGADIPENFLTDYQENFRFIVYPTDTGQIINDYEEKVKYKAIELTPASDIQKFRNRLGGIPNWILEDETPSTYNKNVQMKFLMQLEPNYKFEIHDTGSEQVELDLFGEQVHSSSRYYTLFIGNAVYLFGTDRNQSEPFIYALTQVA